MANITEQKCVKLDNKLKNGANMKKKKFEVTIFYSSFCNYKVEAENEEEAILKARDLPINQNEVFSNIENWQEADTAEINNEETTN